MSRRRKGGNLPTTSLAEEDKAKSRGGSLVVELRLEEETQRARSLAQTETLDTPRPHSRRPVDSTTYL